MDSRKRSWAKAVLWFLLGITLLSVISYLVTGSWKEMTTITILFHAVRVVLYYGHERLWERISWGREKHPLAEIPVKSPLGPEDLRIIEKHLRALGYVE